MHIEEILKIDPYSLNKVKKEKLFSSFLTTLSRFHYANSKSYQKMMDGIGFNPENNYSYTEIPFLPTQLFKTNELISIQKENIVKTLSSSGTSGQNKSYVFLDKETVSNQMQALCKISTSFIGNRRLPMIIIDSQNSMNSNAHVSARAAAVSGFSLFGTKRIFALNNKSELNTELMQVFLKEHEGERIFLFGLTYMVYEYFYKELLRYHIKIDLSNAVLIHGGGWKKLERESVSAASFRNKLNKAFGIRYIYDYYGMAEQTGSIFMQCEYGNYHASVLSEVIIRRAFDFSMADIGEEGIIQVLSLLPKSYPGHSLLTDDKGILIGEDNCPCCRLGKYFRITGRIKNAELRGCSDA